VKPGDLASSDGDVRYGETRRTAIFQADTVLEPISPELVLVDPALRREVLVRELQDLLLEALDAPPARAPVEGALKPVVLAAPQPPPAAAPRPLSEVLHRPVQVAARRRKRRLAPALLPVSVAVNVILIALSVSDARVARTSPPSPLAVDPPSQLAPTPPAKKAQRPAAKTPRRTTPKSKPGAARQSAAMRKTRGEVERKVLNTVIQSPAGKLPQALIDSTTGLAKNGLQAYCRRETRTPSFLCIVRPVRHKAGEGLYVRYRPNQNGAGAFTWFPYRSK
jgi:hypothetical protein